VCLMRHLKAHFADCPDRYVTADLESPLADLHFDVQEIPLADGSFDVVICNHLLEHVADDRKAMRELHRILRPGGWGVLLSPVELDRDRTYEDDTVTDPEERTRIFGQYDHRRIYGRDYADRLREAGFEVEEIDYTTRLGAEARVRYALPEDRIYAVRRPGRS
ncbi:MAG: methyltransferase domain-containing protein, partial [Alistipes sp.]|nr:methyltransferase domain-containing protein [Alistipes sp.]